MPPFLIPIALGAVAYFVWQSFKKDEMPPASPPLMGPPAPPTVRRSAPSAPSRAPIRDLAAQVDVDLNQTGRNYDRGLMQAFQSAALALATPAHALVFGSADGLYGPATAGALQFFTGGPVPQAYIFSDGRVTTTSRIIPFVAR